MMEQIRELGAKLRNLFAAGEFQKRYADGDKKDFVQVRTHNGRVVEKREAFPYGFYAKAKNGRTFVFCQGGNPDGFEIFPVQAGDGVTPPELEEGDVAVYTGEGGYTIYREAGDVEIHAKGEGKTAINTEGGDLEVNIAGDGAVKITCENGKFFFGNGNADNLYAAFRRSMRAVAWKEPVQRFGTNALRNIAELRRKLLSGENIRHGFAGFDLRGRGKIRHIRSVHISGRIVQKCLCDKVLTPILTRP
ncbi:MAG: hypothetical protein LBH70_02100, partial [Spirochaetaceae bacterium]|nr:hypothetical protein [Spirochaetaceae bacterium]